MYVLASNMWFQTLIRTFFFSLDKIVFGFIPRIYNLLMSIARTSILSQANIADMADRIYKLLAVFMIFKVTFSLIMYVVNPDDFSDKSKGISKLVTNIVFSLLILILTPYIFRYAYQFQTIILEDNSLVTLIFGEDGDSSSNVLAGAGSSIAYTTMIPFFSPDTSLVNSCVNIVEQSSTGKNTINPKCFGYKINDNGTLESVDNSQDTLAKIAKDSDDFDEGELKNYTIGIVNQNFSATFRLDMATAKTGSQFVINYNYIISTVLGVIVCLILVSFCLDVAMRSIKLSFLQLIAPIPILSYIDPKSGKDGMFKKWYQMCLKTFASLFLKLLALYFAIYIIGRINGISDIITGEYQSSILVKIFIIIGALMFAKNFTKILEGLGIKLDGGFQLNPLRKVEKEALGGGLLKKPNDTLAKVGTGILKSPFTGLQTLGKKTIGGIDASRHGKGFRQGWDRTHGSLYNAYHKKLDEWAPDSAEARKNERIGKENIHHMEKRFNQGKEAFEQAGGMDSNLKFSPEYRASYDAVNKAKGEMYAAAAWKQAQVAAVEDLLSTGKIDQSQAQARIKEINKLAGTADKRYEVAKARHDEMKKIYAKDAELEDAFDYYDKTRNIDYNLNASTPGSQSKMFENKPISGHQTGPSYSSSAQQIDPVQQASTAQQINPVQQTTPSTPAQTIIIDGSGGGTTARLDEKAVEQIKKEVTDKLDQIHSMETKLSDIDEKTKSRWDSLTSELETLIKEKENADSRQKEEINRDVEKITDELKKILIENGNEEIKNSIEKLTSELENLNNQRSHVDDRQKKVIDDRILELEKEINDILIGKK